MSTDFDKIQEEGLDVVDALLQEVYGFEPDDYTVKAGRTEGHDGRQSVVFDITTPETERGEKIASILIGSGGRTLATLQHVFYTALGRRMDDQGSLGVGAWIAINGRRPDVSILGNGHGKDDQKRQDGGQTGETKIVISVSGGGKVKVE